MDEVERKRKASDNYDGNHLQHQLLIQRLHQPSSAADTSMCCPCLHCHCKCHHAVKKTLTSAAIENAAYLDSIPIGYRFDPTDEELITHYLLRKIQNQTLPKCRISEANIYGDHPKDIVGNYRQAIEGGWYFFTSRNRKYVNGKRPNRKAGSGYWKATGPDKVIMKNGVKIGGKKSLVYYEGHPPNGTKTIWMMHEYVVEGYERRRLDLADMKLDDYVLCKIYYKTERGKHMTEQAVTTTNQQLGEASNDQSETLRTNLEVESERALVPYQQAYLSSNQDVNPPNYLSNPDPTTLHVDNHLLNSNQNMKDQHAHVVTNIQATNLTNENNVVIPHLYQNSNPVTHHVERSFLVQGYSNQHMNTIDPNGDKVNMHVMVQDPQARVLSHQEINNPTINLQVKNNVVVQNCRKVTSFWDLISHNISFNPGYPSENFPYLPLTPRNSPCLPSCSQSCNPLTTSGQAESPGFQKGNNFDQVDLFNHQMSFLFDQDGDDGFLHNYDPELDGHKLDDDD